MLDTLLTTRLEANITVLAAATALLAVGVCAWLIARLARRARR
jgi:hypothetical protein